MAGVLNLFRPTEPFGPKKSFFRGSVFYLKKTLRASLFLI